MPRASTRRSDPSGLNDTTVADHSDSGTQWSQGAEIPSWMRPSGATASPPFWPDPAGNVTTVRWRAKRVPSKPP